MSPESERTLVVPREKPNPGLARLWEHGARVRRRMVRLALVEGSIRALGAWLLVVGLGWLGDWMFDWGVGWRRAACLVYLGSAVLFLRFWWVLPWRRIPSGDRLALFMERREASLRSRVISAVQLGRSVGSSSDGVPEAFVRRLVGEADSTLSKVEPGRLVPSEGVWRAAKFVAPVVLAVTVFWAAGGETRNVLWRRWIGQDVPLPRETTFLEITGPRTVGRGDDLPVQVRVAGVFPKSGQLRLRFGSGREQSMILDGVAGSPGTYERVLANLTSDFRYRVRVHDAESEEFAVEVLPRPVVTNLQVTMVYPEYTRLAPRRLMLGELTLLRGGRLRLEGEAGQALARAEILLEGSTSVVTARVDRSASHRFAVEIPVEDPRWSGFSIRLVDTRGIGSRDPAVYAVSVVEDQSPTVKMILPARREELVTVRGALLISFEAKDDFGVAGLRLMHQPAATTNTTVSPTAIDLELGEDSPSVARRRFEWKLAEMKPPLREGEFLEFWVEATDRRVEGGPGVGRTERYLARIVSEAEKRSDLLTRAGDAIGRLGDVARGQERLNESLGRIILERAPPRGTAP